MALNLGPVIRQRFFDSNANPLAGGKLYTYAAGTSTPQTTYSDSSSTPNANPIILDANGECNMWLDPSLSYKFILQNSAGVQQWSVDNVIGLSSADTIATASLQDLAVTTAKLADDAVTAAKLADDATIDANRAVTTDHIRDGAVKIIKLADAAKGFQILNGALTASVASNALTIALKGIDGNNPSTSNPVYVAFRNSTSATGTPVIRAITSALSLVVSSGSTLGTISAQAQDIHVYLLDSSGTVEIAVAGARVFDDGSVQSTTAEGGAGAADSKYVLYSTTSRSNVPIRYMGRIRSTQATAGTWATAVSEIALIPFGVPNQIRSIVKVTTPNGFGSTNTKIRKYTVTEISIGSDITYASSSTNGDSMTINREGLYVFSVCDYRTGGADYVGISKNSTQLTTDIDTLSTPSQAVGLHRCTVASVYFTLTSAPTRCDPGDVIRSHSLGLSDATSAFAYFQAVRIGD